MKATWRNMRRPTPCDTCGRQASTKKDHKQHQVRVIGDAIVCKRCCTAAFVAAKLLQDDRPEPYYPFHMPAFATDAAKRLMEQDHVFLSALSKPGAHVGQRGTFVLPVRTRGML